MYLWTVCRDIPVDFKYIADPSMHSMPAVALSPNGKLSTCCVVNVAAVVEALYPHNVRLIPSFCHKLSVHSCLSLTRADLEFDHSVFGSHWQWWY